MDKTQTTENTKPTRGMRKMMPTEKAKDFKGSIKMFGKYCKPYLKAVGIAVGFAVLSSILSIIGPGKLKELTNLIVEGIVKGIDLDSIKRLGIILGVLYIFSLIFGYLQAYIMTDITNKFSKKMRGEITQKINKIPLSFIDKREIGDIMSVITNDVDTMGMTLHHTVGHLTTSIVTFIGTIFMMFITNWIMAITAILTTVIGFVLMKVILGNSQKYFTALQEGLGKLNGHIEETYSGHEIVKVYNGTEGAKEEFNNINDNLYNSMYKSQFISGLMQPIMNFIGNFGYVAVCIVGAILVNYDMVLFGDIVAFMIYIRLFTNPLSHFAQSATQLQSCAAASERVFEFLGEKELPDEKHIMASKNNAENNFDIENIKGEIEFKNVKFSYDGAKDVIKDFSLKVKPGQNIAIVGPTGAGKTTLVNLLMKFYEINSGDILIDGVSINSLTRKQIHDMFVMVLQDTWVFNGTIKENIVYNNKDVSDEKIHEVCKEVGIEHFILSQPNGYDTILGDIESISAGQKQLLTIARANIKNSPFLILDEATSSVDTRTEKKVQDAMARLSQNRTSFIIAHRLSTIKNADLILVLDEGDIVEKGTHDELIKKNGFYAKLYNSQFEKV